MWIRSQNKECLVKLDDFVHYFYDDRENEHGIGSHMITLGVYESKERALEVLDEIQKILNPQLIIKDSGKIIGSFEDTLIREGATYELKELSTYVYEMPEK